MMRDPFTKMQPSHISMHLLAVSKYTQQNFTELRAGDVTSLGTDGTGKHRNPPQVFVHGAGYCSFNTVIKQHHQQEETDTGPRHEDLSKIVNKAVNI